MRHSIPTIFAIFAILVSTTPVRAGFVATLTGVGPGATPGHYGISEYVVQIKWNQNQVGGHDADWISHSFVSFCIQRNQNVYFGGTYDFTTSALDKAPIPGAAMGIGAANQIRRLWAADRGSLGNDNIKNAAFQEAIWKILDSTYVVDSQVAAQVNLFLLDANNTAKPMANLVALTSEGYQDQIVEVSKGWTVAGDGKVVPTPTPSGLILMLSAVAPIMAYRRFRREASGSPSR